MISFKLKHYTKRKAVTLIEVLIAISLLGFVIISVTTVDLFMRRQFQETDIRAHLLNEISPAMEHMLKNLAQGIGDINNPGINTDSIGGDRAFRVRIDRNNTPHNYADDVWVAYRYRSAAAPSGRYQIWYCNNCANPPCTTCSPAWGSEVIAKKIYNTTFTLSGNNLLGIEIIARQDPTSPSSLENPEVRLNSQAYLRSTATR